MILNNPLIRRYRYSLMRPRQLWIYVTIYVTLVGLLLFLNYAAYKNPRMLGVPVDFFQSVCYQLVILQALLLCAVGAYNSASAIREEISGKSYDFFRMLPLSAGQKAAGILVGKNLVVLLFAAVTLVPVAIFGGLGQVSPSLLRQVFFALLSVALLMNSVALLSSINRTSPKKRSSVGALILLILFVVPFGMRVMVSAWRIGGLEDATGRFYIFELPVLILAGLIALYFSAWSVIGVLRRFTREDEPLFSRAGAYVFMIGYEFVLLGLFYAHLTGGGVSPGWINYCYWLISLLPVLAVPVWSLRGFEKYLEYSGSIRIRSAESGNVMARMLLYSNLSVDFGLFAVWAACATGTTLIAGLDWLPHVYVILVLLSFYLFLVLLLELYVVCAPVSNKMGLLVGFIATVYVALPVILYGILDAETLYLYSPVGFLFGMFQKPNGEIPAQGIILAMNLLLSVIPAVLIWKRHLHILSTRQKM